MTTYFSISDMPEEIQDNEFRRLDHIWCNGQMKTMDALNFLSSLYNSREGEFRFEREIDYPNRDTFFADIRLQLPLSVEARLPQLMSDFSILATAIANYNLGLERPTTQKEQQ